MINDLAEQQGDQTAAFDVCIIGAGIAGLILAVKLRSYGISVGVLESGGLSQSEDVDRLNHVVNENVQYKGATLGRARCLGGTSTLWGGAMLPFLEQDIEARPHVDLPAWPVSMAELSPFIPEVEKLFGVDSKSYDEEFLKVRSRDAFVPVGDSTFLLRFAKWPVFKLRNVATLFRAALRNDSGLAVWLNATVASFACDQVAGRLQQIFAKSINGRKIGITAKHFILCAGSIETTRLLLLLNRQYGERIFEGCEALGHYFHDHISFLAANIRSDRPALLNKLAGFRFCGNTMRSLRFELSPQAQAQGRTGSGYAHISFRTGGGSGFDALRETLRSLQKDGRLNFMAATQSLKDLPYLMRAAYWRFGRQQLLWPPKALHELHIVTEQLPRAPSKIALAPQTDALGCPMAMIDWRVEAFDCNAVRLFAQRFDSFWKRRGLDRVGRLEWAMNLDTYDPDVEKNAADTYHPGGTTRMGAAPRSSVVDRNLSVFAVPNLSVASTSTFPSGPSANPTMMLMLFSLRLADHLANQLKLRPAPRLAQADDAPLLTSKTQNCLGNFA